MAKIKKNKRKIKGRVNVDIYYNKKKDDGNIVFSSFIFVPLCGTQQMMNLELAEKIILEAEKKAQEMGIPMCIAVVDQGANLVAMKRMDGAMIAAISLSRDKAYTSAATGFPTDGLGAIAQPGQLAYGIALADQGRLIIFAGGLPIKTKNGVIGGIGVSGGLATDDKKVAEAGLSVVE